MVKTTNMKMLLSLVLGSSIVLFASLKSKSDPKYKLQDAIQSKLVQVKLKSLGGYSDSSVQLTVTNVSAKGMEIVIPKGTLFVPSDPGEQTLVLPENHLIVLQPSKTKSLVINAYCTEAGDRSPAENQSMSLSFNSNKGLMEILNLSTNKPELKDLLQDAIWAVTDGNSVSNIYAGTASQVEFRKKVAEITNQTDPWYSSPQVRTVNANREIVTSTKKINGELYFDLTSSGTVFQAIYNKGGTLLMKSKNSQILRPGKNIHFTFNIEVQGWEPGEYYVTLNQGTRVINKYDFTI